MAEGLTDLVDEVYATTLDPARYDALMRQWEAYIETQVAAAAARPRQVVSDTLLERHVSRALDIFDQLGRSRRTRQSAEAVLAGLPMAALVIDERQAVVAANSAAEAFLPPGAQRHLDHVQIDEAARAKLLAWLAGRRFQIEPALFLPCHLGPEAAPSCLTAIRVDLSHPLALAGFELDIHGGSYFLLTTVDLRLDEETAGALAKAYQLSPAEAEVGLALARGRAPAVIAAQRQVSLNTVRTQIKVLLRKLNAASIPDLVRILSGFAACVAACRTMTSGSPDRSKAYWHRRKGTLRLPDGRQLAYEDSGAANGRPVLFVHNLLLGPSLTDPAIEVASRKGWRFIAPSRPGFGHSEPLPQLREGALIDAFARDAVRLLDHLGIEQALLIGHLSGGVYALRLAELAPERFQGLVLVSYMPLYRDEILASLPARQRAFALTIRYAPHLLPFLARAGAAHIDAGCEDQLLRTLHGNIPADLAALRRPEVRKVVIDGLRHTVQQGADAFCRDCPTMLVDWSARARKLRLPGHLILGGEDRFVQVAYGREFMRTAPQFGLSVVEEAGLYLLYTHWPKLFEVLELLHARPVQPLAASA
jgi:pimeloyl-ACP methyl ester carboxylesterase/DNA-binding CsgD family transcriptional regulator